MKCIFQFIINIIKKRINRNDVISTKTVKLKTSPKVSQKEIYDENSTIKRSGRRIVIINSAGEAVPISHKQIECLGAALKRNYGTATIKTIGLSKAQVGRVAGDLKSCTSSDVFVRKIKPQDLTTLQPMKFEITLIGDNTNEEKKQRPDL